MAGIGSYGLDIAIAAITIMIAIGGIAIGLGFALNNRRLKELGTEELFQSVLNGALVGGFVFLFLPNGAITGIVNALAVSNSTSISCSAQVASNYAICFAYDYLAGSGYTLNGIYHESILSQSTGLTVSLLGLNAILGAVAGLSLSASVLSISFSYIMNPIIVQIQYFIKALTTVSIGVLVQSSMLTFIAASAITVILPVGLVLRTFYPTRKVGGFLIAVAIGAYILFPLSYVLDANILSSYSTDSINSTIMQLSGSAGGVEGQVLSANSNPSKNNGLIEAVTSAAYAISSGFSAIVSAVISAISYFIIAAVILPAFSLVITVISIRELSSMLGSEVSFGLLDLV